MKLFLVLMLAALPVLAGNILRFGWDNNNPAENVKVYNLYEFSGSNRVQIASVSTNSMSLTNVSVDRHVYSLTALNAFGESGNSALIVVNKSQLSIPPSIPTNVTVTVTVNFTVPVK